MEPKDVVMNIRVSKTEKKMLAEIAKRLDAKEAHAFRYAIRLAYELTDPQKHPDALKNVLVVA